MKEIYRKNIFGEEPTTWTDDKGIRYTEMVSKIYESNNAIISAGLIENHPYDTMYLKFSEKDDDENEKGQIIFLRPDEMATVSLCASGALVCLHSRDKGIKEREYFWDCSICGEPSDFPVCDNCSESIDDKEETERIEDE